MRMPTKEQRVRFLVHHAWDLRDEGNDNATIVQHIIEEGVPPDIANRSAYEDVSREWLVVTIGEHCRRVADLGRWTT